MNERVAVVGVGWFGFQPTTPDYSYKEIMYQAARRAYTDAGVDPRRDIQNFVTVAEDFHEGTSIFDEYTPDQLGAALKPMQTIPGDGLHGLATAYMLVRTGQFDLVAVEAHSKASNLLTHDEVTAYAQDPVINRPLRLNSNFIAGMEMNRYLYDCGTTPAQCAAVVVKNKENALKNPDAAYAEKLRVEDVLDSDPIAWPLRKQEAAQHADGAIVMVLASEKYAQSLIKQPIWISGVGWCNDSPALENRCWSQLPYLKKAAHMAYRQAGIQNPRGRIDFAEVDDLYAYKELQSLEALGFFDPGEAGKATSDGSTHPTGELPVNVSGGSLGVGHLLDATGLAKALEVILQLRGQAGLRQLENVKVGLAQSWRGVPTSSTAVAIFHN
jgi:acetyl-CoA C-acetyltransferase